MIIAGMVLGADGGVGSTYNFVPSVINRVMKNTEEGNIAEARTDQFRVQQACRVAYRHGM